MSIKGTVMEGGKLALENGARLRGKRRGDDAGQGDAGGGEREAGDPVAGGGVENGAHLVISGMTVT